MFGASILLTSVAVLQAAFVQPRDAYSLASLVPALCLAPDPPTELVIPSSTVLKPSDRPLGGDGFGFSIAMDGDYLVAGAWFDSETVYSSGAAYVFHRADGEWTEQAKLKASNATFNGRFGRSVAMNGDIIVVGAGEYTGGIYNGPGKAYVFRRNGTTWTEEIKLAAPQPAFGDSFGISVGVSGDVAVIGRPSYDFGLGSAHVFRYDGDTWIAEHELVGSQSTIGDRTGRFVAIDGDRIAIGAIADDHAGVRSGAAYVFAFDGKTWIEEARLTASDAHPKAFFCRVSINGDTLIVGAPGAQGTGTAYVFEHDSSAWVERFRLTSPVPEFAYSFGFSLKQHGCTMIVGDAEEGYWDGFAEGDAYLFRRGRAQWYRIGRLSPEDPDRCYHCGIAVSVEGDTVVVGSEAGAVFLFKLQSVPVLLLEFSQLQNCWGFAGREPGPDCENFDLNRNNKLDMDDHARLLQPPPCAR